MFPYIGDGRLNFVPHHMDRFPHFLRGAFSVNVKGTGKLEFVQVFIYCSKEIYDRLVLFEHATQAGSRVTALKQVDKKGDEEEEDGDQKAERSWFHWEVDAFHPKGIFLIDLAQFIQNGSVHNDIE